MPALNTLFHGRSIFDCNKLLESCEEYQYPYAGPRDAGILTVQLTITLSAGLYFFTISPNIILGIILLLTLIRLVAVAEALPLLATTRN